MCLNYKEYLKRLKEGQEQREKSVAELKTSINNTMIDIQTLMQRPHWEKTYRGELFGIFVDTWDKMIEDNKKFKEEFDNIFK